MTGPAVFRQACGRGDVGQQYIAGLGGQGAYKEVASKQSADVSSSYLKPEADLSCEAVEMLLRSSRPRSFRLFSQSEILYIRFEMPERL